MINRFSVIGAAAVLAALALFGTNLGPGAVVHAGIILTSTPTFTATATPCPLAPCTPTPPVSVQTATPTSTPAGATTGTPVSTSTLAPPTSVPNTPVPPAATSPAGAVGAGIRAPNTGTGDGTAAGSGFPWALATGIALLAMGSSSLPLGVRRRS
ncbi:MAG: hypothetical protein ACYDEB_13795 [Dehalococcoidia bacterium]